MKIKKKLIQILTVLGHERLRRMVRLRKLGLGPLTNKELQFWIVISHLILSIKYRNFPKNKLSYFFEL